MISFAEQTWNTVENDPFQTQTTLLVQLPTVGAMFAPQEPLNVLDEGRL